MKTILNFVTTLAVVLSGVFVVHVGVLLYLNLIWSNHLLLESYLSNYSVTALIFLLLFTFRKKYRDQLGFLFMGGSFLKFAMFFVFFAPTYRTDGEIQTTEFLAFFVPYIVCLVVETLRIIRLVNDKK